MRLLHFDSSGSLTTTDFSGKSIPPYAILSHTWSGDDEFLFEHLVNNASKTKAGYQKILFCSKQAARDGLKYFWIDTCCIDKWDRVELSIAINSMFQWYRNAAKCYVFLTDVSTNMTDPQLHRDTWEASFRKARWFTRGWTLQELIAPASVEFFSVEGQPLGDKRILEQQISRITRVPTEVLQGESLENFSVEERMKWMEGRKTKEEEDMAYSLIGILQLSMEFKYGEGKERALSRLEDEVKKVNTTPFVVPFAQNTRFVGRESQLTELEGKLFVGTSTRKFAITGPGGIGKTQVALELAYRTRREHKDCLVLWIPANDLESHHQAYTSIARRLGILGWGDEKMDVKKLVQLHLSKESTGQWLLIFDNVEDERVETAGLSKRVNLAEYLPRSKQGAIVFTTTHRGVAAALASQNVVELPDKEEDLARKMLETCLTNLADEQEESDLLLQELAYLPLAIAQAVAYININKITPKAYLLLLAKQKEKLSAILVEECRNDRQYPSIVTTWYISFEQIQSRYVFAANYALLMACLDHKDIPLALLPAFPPSETEDPIETLYAYSLITKRPAQSAVELHRLVHLATRQWLQSQNLLTEWSEAAFTRLLEDFPDDKHGNRSKWRRLLPHAKFVLSSESSRRGNENRTGLIMKCAASLLSDGRYDEAEEYFQEAMETRKRVLGQEHPSTLTSMANLASTFWNQGRWKEAEDLQAEQLKICLRALGQEHPFTLTSMTNLASTYRNQGRWKEAEDLQAEELKICLRVLGQEHPHTLISMANQASTFWNQGRLKEAEVLDALVLETRKRVLGQEHPHTLISMANLASIFWNQGRWKESEDLEVLVLETRKRVLGQEHPHTLTSMANLASTFWNQGRWKEAEDLEVLVLQTRKRVLGQEHPDTLTSMTNLAFTWNSNDRRLEGTRLLKECIQLRTRVLGAHHPATMSSQETILRWQSEDSRD